MRHSTHNSESSLCGGPAEANLPHEPSLASGLYHKGWEGEKDFHKEDLRKDLSCIMHL